MKLTGETVQCPILENVQNKYRGLFEQLAILITDVDLLEATYCGIVDLEWCDLFYEVVNKEHGGNLTRNRLRAEYDRFYEKVFERYLELKPYLYFTEQPKLNIPPKQGDIYEKLIELLKDDEEALNLIKNFYPFERKRLNKRERNNLLVAKAVNSLKNPEKYIKAAKWQYVEAVENKVFTFTNVFDGNALTLKDNVGNSYTKFTKIHITDISEEIILTKDIDYELHGFGTIVILPPLIQKCTNIKIVISTEKSKFKRISH